MDQQQRPAAKHDGGGVVLGVLVMVALLLAGTLLSARNDAQAAMAAMIAQVASNARADLFIANQETGAQKARNGRYDDTDTIGFSDLEEDFPWLEDLRRTVAYLRSDTSVGSAVLLDTAGTVALCAHELPTGQQDSLRLFFNIRSNGQTIEVKPRDFVYDRPHDLMFASIDPALVSYYHLLPVRWGQLNLQSVAQEAGSDLISVGWPMPSFRLHATRGVITGASLSERYRNTGGGLATLTCKVRSNAVTFGGMSGGGVFSDQRLLGIVNAGTSPGIGASTDFTPVDLVREAYISLFPARSLEAGVTELDATDTPAECRFDKEAVSQDR